MKNNLREQFGNIDIYLFDQLLKGTFEDYNTVLDAGCGNGRNLVYFLQNNYNVFGIDQSDEAIGEVKKLSAQLAPLHPLANFTVSPVENLPFENNSFDLVVSNAVLHFANDEVHFDKMVHSMWRVLKPGGFLFARLGTDIGIEHLKINIGNGRYLLPDDSEWFLANLQMLLNYTRELKGELYEPIKTTNVQNLRCMTTWCLRKAFPGKMS